MFGATLSAAKISVSKSSQSTDSDDDKNIDGTNRISQVLWTPQIAEWLRTSLHRSSVQVIFLRWKLWTKAVANRLQYIGLQIEPQIGQFVLPAQGNLNEDIEAGVPGRITSIDEGKYREVFVQWFSNNEIRGPYILPHRENSWEVAQINFNTSGNKPEVASAPLILATHQAIQEALDVHYLPELAKHYVAAFPDKQSYLSATYHLKSKLKVICCYCYSLPAAVKENSLEM